MILYDKHRDCGRFPWLIDFAMYLRFQVISCYVTVPCKISFPDEHIRIHFKSLFERALKRASV